MTLIFLLKESKNILFSKSPQGYHRVKHHIELLKIALVNEKKNKGREEQLLEVGTPN